MVNTKWSATDQQNASLDGTKLVATSASGQAAVRGADGILTGQCYWECTFTKATNADTGVGIMLGNTAFTLLGSNAVGGCMIYRGFPVYLNGSQRSPVVSIGTITTGSVVAIACDFSNKLIWFRLGVAGLWNGSSTADPATGSGGISFAALAPGVTSYHPAASMWQTSDSITANFGDSAFVGVVPTGFTSGFPAGLGPPISLAVTETGANVWYTTNSPPLRVTALGAEAWSTGHPSASVTKLGATVWISGPARLRVTKAGAEAWVDIYNKTLTPSSIKSSLSFGRPFLLYAHDQTIVAVGIPSELQFGTPDLVQPHLQTLFPDGIESTLEFGILQGDLGPKVLTIPRTALIPSDYYYTDLIGGGLGIVMVTTGGGSAANVGIANGRNDDGFRGPISLGFDLQFFGHTYSSFYLNNNGNISFNEGIDAYTPVGPQGQQEPIISPYFADVDTRGPLSGVAWFRQDIPDQLIVTWDNVGYYSGRDELTDSFQLVVRGPNYVIPPGEGTIGFFYKSMQWETGSASGGINGFLGTPAAVGFGDGLLNGEILEGSTQSGISTVVNHSHIWFDLSLTPVPRLTSLIVNDGRIIFYGAQPNIVNQHTTGGAYVRTPDDGYLTHRSAGSYVIRQTL